VQLGALHAVEEFLEGEVERRREHALPPFGHLVRVVVEGPRPQAAVAAAAELAGALREAAPELGLRGPAPLHRLRGRTRRALLVSAPRAGDVTGPLRALLDERAERFRRAEVRASVDVDPQET